MQYVPYYIHCVLSDCTFCLQLLQKILIPYSLTTYSPAFKVCIAPVLCVIFGYWNNTRVLMYTISMFNLNVHLLYWSISSSFTSHVGDHRPIYQGVQPALSMSSDIPLPYRQQRDTGEIMLKTEVYNFRY